MKDDVMQKTLSPKYYLTDHVSYVWTDKGWEYCFQGHTKGQLVTFSDQDEARAVLAQNPLTWGGQTKAAYVSQVKSR